MASSGHLAKMALEDDALGHVQQAGLIHAQ